MYKKILGFVILCIATLMMTGCRPGNWSLFDTSDYGMGGGQIDLTLPFQSGEYWILTQGYGSTDEDYRGSHRDYGSTYSNDLYALDFTQSGCEAYGKEVTPLADGMVMAVYTGDTGYGNNVLIDHGNGFVSRYAHLSEILVETDDGVYDSDPIGLVGDSGYVYGTACSAYPGTHLHISFYRDEEAQKPEPLSGNNNLDEGCWYNREGDENCGGDPGDYTPVDESESMAGDDEPDSDEEEGEEGEEDDNGDAYDDDGDYDIDDEGELSVAFLDISPEQGTADETEYVWVATVVSPDLEPEATLYIKNPNDGVTYDFEMETESEESPYVFTYRKTLNDPDSTYTYWVKATNGDGNDSSSQQSVHVDEGDGDEPHFLSTYHSPNSGEAGETEFEWAASGESESTVEVYLVIVNPNDAMLYTFTMGMEWNGWDDEFVAEYKKTLRDATVYPYWFLVENEDTANTSEVMSIEVD